VPMEKNTISLPIQMENLGPNAANSTIRRMKVNFIVNV
jgi:hypothetical protein